MTTFNDTYDFGIGRKLENLPRLLELELQTQLPTDAATQFERIVMPGGEGDQRTPGLRFGDPRVVPLFAGLARFELIADGFRARDLQPLIADYLGEPYSMSRMAYDLRRLRLSGLIERRPDSHRYQLTAVGRRMVPFCGKLYTRAVCCGLRYLDPRHPPTPLARAARAYDAALGGHLVAAGLCA